MIPLKSPDVVLSGIHGSVESQGFYHLRDNKILLTWGMYMSPIGEEPDQAGHCVEVLNHELAHWATFMYLTPKERRDVMREYETIVGDCEAGGGDPDSEQHFTLLERIAKHVSNLA